jgi:oligoendopeptidase F
MADLSFYNFPYTFGYLFAQGLFERARADGPSFWPRYERLLRDTASAEAPEVARRAIGVDVEATAFWHESIDGIERDLDAFERVTVIEA